MGFRAEFFLEDYMYKIGNFNGHMIHTCFNPEGYYDHFNSDTTELSTPGGKNVIELRQFAGHRDGTNIRYEFALCPNVGFLASPDLLMKDCELKITFDRAAVENALVQVAAPTTECKTLEIKDCVAVTEWVSSPSMTSFFKDVENNPIVYKYDEIEVLAKPLPMNDRIIRLDNLKGGNIPTYLFAGMIPTAALTGDVTLSSTNFACNNVEQLNISLNGHSVTGFPIDVHECSDTNVLYQFNDTIGRLHNNGCGHGLKKAHFISNFIWAHHFEAEITSQGWIGMDIKLKEPLTKSYTMVVWLIYPMSVTIDKFHNIEKQSH